MPSMPPLGVAVRLAASLSAVFVLSQFYRTAVAVIAPDLAREFALSAERLGLVTGAFFFAIALMQLPIGVALDRYGPRRTVPLLLMLAVLGALIFAAAPSGGVLILGQTLIGAGCAGVFMGGLVTFSRWFPAERFASISAVAIATGGVGGMLSGTPFALVAETFGWRGAYVGLAAVTAALALLVFLVVRDAPQGHPYHERRPETLAQAFAGIREVLRHAGLPAILSVGFVSFSILFSLRALWAGPYLADVHGLGAVARGNVLLAMGGAMIAGTLIYGALERLVVSRKRVVLAGAGVNVVLFATLALLPRPGLWTVAVLFCAVALAGAYYIHLLAHTRSIFPDRLMGRALTTLNFAAFAGVSALQLLPGLVVGAFPAEGGAAPEAAYRAVFAVLGLVVLVGVVPYARTSHTLHGLRRVQVVAPPGESKKT